MLEAVVGSEGAERVLLFLAARRQGYALEIANTFGMSVSNVQRGGRFSADQGVEIRATRAEGAIAFKPPTPKTQR